MKHTPQHKALMKILNQEKAPRIKGMVYKKVRQPKGKNVVRESYEDEMKGKM